MREIRLDYFKDTGKWYCGGTFKSEFGMPFEVVDEVRRMRIERRLPGLHKDHGSFIVVITFDGGTAPHLLL